MNALSLYRFVHFKREPATFFSALSKRAMELAEADPTVDLMKVIQPQTLAEQNKLSQLLYDFLDKCTYFENVHFLVSRVLKRINFDPVLHYKYWSKVTGLLVNQDSKSDVKGTFRDYFDDSATDFADEDLIISSDPILKRNIAFAYDYIILRGDKYQNFSHPEFEQRMTGLILQLFQDYDDGKIILLPRGYANCFAFLLSIGYDNLEIRKSFVGNFRINDLLIIQRGLELSRRNNTSVVNVLIKQAERILSSNLTVLEFNGVLKLNLKLLKHFEFHPSFTTCMKMADSNEFWNNSLVPKEFLALMVSRGFYFPEALERASKMICEFPNDVSVLLAEKFLWACFIFGVEGIKGIEESARIISRNSHELYPILLLKSALALCFQGCLDREMVAKTFSPEFFDEVDRYIKASHDNSQTPRILRDFFMELNRAVCLDMPEANVPWFHEKYCSEVAAIEGYRGDTYLHSEVAQVLEYVLGNGYFARRTYSPYFYPIDFLIEINEFGQPVKISSKPSQEKVEGARIAIIVQSPRDFSRYQWKLKGRHILMKRHLEIMGYRVISIDPNHWKHMHMSGQSAKNEYVKSCIFN